MSHCRDALIAAGLPVDPRDGEHFKRFWRVPPATHKWCQRCHEYKALDDFHLGNGLHERQSRCKRCRSTQEAIAA